jgi:hypothetical protein
MTNGKFNIINSLLGRLLYYALALSVLLVHWRFTTLLSFGFRDPKTKQLHDNLTKPNVLLENVIKIQIVYGTKAIAA